MQSSRPAARQPFVQEHGWGIVAAVIAAVIAAGIIAVASGAWEAAWDRFGGGDGGVDPPPATLVGTWRFDRYEPGPPPPPESEFEPVIEYRTLQLLDDWRYVVTYRLSFPAGPGMDGRDSGTYAVDDGTIRFEGDSDDGGLSALGLAVGGGELSLTDRSLGITLVFERAPD